MRKRLASSGFSDNIPPAFLPDSSSKSHRTRQISTCDPSSIQALPEETELRSFLLANGNNAVLLLQSHPAKDDGSQKKLYVLREFDSRNQVLHELIYFRWASDDPADFILLPNFLSFGTKTETSSPARVLVRSMDALPDSLKTHMVLNDRLDEVEPIHFLDKKSGEKGVYFKIVSEKGDEPQYISLFRTHWDELISHSELGSCLCPVEPITSRSTEKQHSDFDWAINEKDNLVVSGKEISVVFRKLLDEMRFYHNHDSSCSQFRFEKPLEYVWVSIVTNPERVTVVKRGIMYANLHSIASYDSLQSLKEKEPSLFSQMIQYFSPSQNSRHGAFERDSDDEDSINGSRNESGSEVESDEEDQRYTMTPAPRVPTALLGLKPYLSKNV